MADATIGNNPIMGANLSPGQDWGSLLGSLFSGYQAVKGQPTDAALKAAQIADPMMTQRGQYQDQLSGLMKDPSSYLKDPMFTAPLKLGGESLARQFGAAGMGLSGNTDAALQDYGQASGHKYLMDQLQELNLLSGASQGSPATAGSLLARGTQDQNAAIGGGLAGLGSLIPMLLSGLGLGGGSIGGLGGALGSLFRDGGLGGVNSVGGIPGNQSGGIDLGGYNDLAPGGIGSVGGIGGDQGGGIDLGGWNDLSGGLDNWDLNFDLGGSAGFDDTLASMFNP